jgi:NADPH-dependent 2,4-dienoyl-CoA reductase/sulfur reductase-like enzyme
MEKKVDVLTVGCGPAGMISAVTAKKYYRDKNVMVMKSIENGCIPCGIPYMFSSLKNPDDNKLGNMLLEKNGINAVIDEAVKIDRENKSVLTKKNDIYRYEKLILATGSAPANLPIKGIEKEGVYTIYKDMIYLKQCVEKNKAAKNILIIGGGFIGVEFADEMAGEGKNNVYLVEVLPKLLANSFDPEFSCIIEEKLRAKGVKVILGVKVDEIIGNNKVEKVRLSNGEELEIDSIILGVGASPNVQIAADAGLRTVNGKGIWVDEYMRTSDTNIFAVGDCACKKDFYTRRDISVMLASTATAEARIAGANLFQIKIIRENSGTIAIYSTYVDGQMLGSAGLTETFAKKEGFEVIVSNVEGAYPSSVG